MKLTEFSLKQVLTQNPISSVQMLYKKIVNVCKAHPNRASSILVLICMTLSMSVPSSRQLLMYINSTHLLAEVDDALLDSSPEKLTQHLNELEVFYLEELLLMNSDKKFNKEIMSSYNAYLDKEFYHFDKVELSFSSPLKKKKILKKYNKKSLEEKLLATLPQNLIAKAKPYIKPLLIISEKYRLDPFWLVSVMWTESHFEMKAVSGKGAIGLMQIMPETRAFLLEIVNKRSIRLEAMKGWNYLAKIHPEIKSWTEFKKYKASVQNIELGAIYLTYLLNRFESPIYATIAYNMGPGWIYNRRKQNKPIGKKNEYLTKVLRAYQQIIQQINNV